VNNWIGSRFAVVAAGLLGWVPAACAAEPALAVDESVFNVSFEVTADGVSDYRYRGVSLSGQDAAAQIGATLTYDMVAIGVWTSTIARTPGGSTHEVDLTASLSQEVAGFEVSATALAYLYPGDGNAAYGELGLGISRDLGPVSLGLAMAYAPRQKNLGHDENFYTALTAGISTRIADVSASVGRETGAFAPGGKWDWSLGGGRQFGPLTASLTYIDSDRAFRDAKGRNLSDATVVARMSFALGHP
jgi:uncharacterized protein (TIGR02001 family)